jgi:hypothetical protein
MKEEKQQTINLAPVAPEKLVPKFCTSIMVNLLQNKNIVLTMLYGENAENNSVIERIVIDLNHAKSLKEIIDKVIVEADNVSS